MTIRMKTLIQLTTVSLCVALISACSDDEEIVEVERIVEVEVPAPVPDTVDFVYEVTVTNLTSAQPLSPVALVAHEDGHLWQVGEAASVELEVLAEGGDNSGLLNLAGWIATSSGAAPIAPGMNETLQITVQDNDSARLSFATMLVNTNDAFAGLDAYDLGQLSEVGMSWSTRLPTLDAGTEVNSESAGTIPGPADGGEGYNPMRTGRGVVYFHQGAVTSDDGLSTSVLTAEHKFDNPSVGVMVTRIQ